MDFKKHSLNIVIIFNILYSSFFFSSAKLFLTSYLVNNEYKKIENYLKICNSSKDFDSSSIRLSNNPKISIITPVFNTGKLFLRLLRSIQFQYFKDFEIIIIDDYSTDDSVELIKKYKSEDKRIKLIKNNIPKGTFACRNIGILYSKGNYIMLPDSDDILLKNSLRIFYCFSVKHNYELIRFNIYRNFGMTFFGSITKKLQSRQINQPELSTFIFYGLGYLKQVDFNVSNKFVKREAIIRALNIFKKNELYLFMTVYEDGLLNYILYRTAKSFYFLKKFGYYYIKNEKKNRIRIYYNIENFEFKLIHIMYVFVYSKNTKYEKDMTNEIFKRLIFKKRLPTKLHISKKSFDFFIYIIELLRQNQFFLNKYKKYIAHIKKKFLKKINEIIL